MFSPARTSGTLRAYFRHHASDDVLANPGEQDLTAHVNFSAIQKAGEDAGLKTESFSDPIAIPDADLEKIAKDETFGEMDCQPHAAISNPHPSGTSGPRLPRAGSNKARSAVLCAPLTMAKIDAANFQAHTRRVLNNGYQYELP